MHSRHALLCLLAACGCALAAWGLQRKDARPVRVTGEVRDGTTDRLLPARIYVQSEAGTWYFPRSQSDKGSALSYRKQRPNNPRSVEMHTTLSAHPFAVDLPPGKYTITVERGKEYLPQTRSITVGRDPTHVLFALQRWIDAAKRGWYSGDTHVHRSLEELPNVMLAEDLNVALPLLSWVTEAFTPPRVTGKEPEAKVIAVDPTHVIYPRNTEYEIFTVGKNAHTLGAFFVLRHKRPFDRGVPPVKPIAAEAHRQGGLIELDKPNWPWSVALVPLMKVDLFELSNNHVWRTEFGFPTFGEPPPRFMNVQRDAKGFTEWGWIDFNFKHYYLLLNCGYRLRPTAGTASGVHPVPLGFGRVYVHQPAGFSFDSWFHGLDAGRSFVTTGPMLFVECDGRAPGEVFRQSDARRTYRLHGTAASAVPLRSVEVVVNGKVERTLNPDSRRTRQGGWESVIDHNVTVAGSSWLAVRCFEDRPDRRVRFAHTGPWHVEVAGRPLVPAKEEIGYLIQRVQEQITRSKDVLTTQALDEYREAVRLLEQRR